MNLLWFKEENYISAKGFTFLKANNMAQYVKAFASMADDLTFILGTHMVEGENLQL